MEEYFSNCFEDIRYERSVILLLSLTDPDDLIKSNFTEFEIDLIEKSALKKLNRQRILKEHVAMDLL